MMTEREFVTQYLLNRAKGHRGGIGVEDVIKSGRKAYKLLLDIPNSEVSAERLGVDSE